MTESFEALVGPVFEEVADFLDAVRRGDHPPLDRQKRALKETLADASKHARQAEGSGQGRSFDRVFPVLVYWIDEVLTNSGWAHAGEWRDAILEFEYFGTRNAFDDFWDRAKEAEAAAEGRERACRASGKLYTGDDDLEAVFLCVALGFRGKLYLDLPALNDWVARVRHLIDPSPAPGDSPRGGPRDWGLRPLRGDRVLLACSWLLSASVVLAVLGFIASVHAGRSAP